MNKTLEILFDDFESKKLGQETQARFNLLCEAMQNGCTHTGQEKIDDALGDYTLAREAEAFKAGFYSAVRLLMGGGQV